MKTVSVRYTVNQFANVFWAELEQLHKGEVDYFEITVDKFRQFYADIIDESLSEIKQDSLKWHGFITMCNNTRNRMNDLMGVGYLDTICDIYFDKKKQVYIVRGATMLLKDLVSYHTLKVPKLTTNRVVYVHTQISKMLKSGKVKGKDQDFLELAQSIVENAEIAIITACKSNKKVLIQLSERLLPELTNLYLPYGDEDEDEDEDENDI